jgi:hypothetical protein
MRTLIVMLLVSGLIACSTETPPTDPATQAERTDPQGNPLKGTVLDAQGEAMKKARGVEDTLAKSAEARREAADAAAE